MYKNVKEWFENFIDNFKPYADEKLHQAISNYIKNTYLKDSYENIPIELKKYVEEYEIVPNLYDKILISCGYRKSLLQRTTQLDKKILVQSLTDINHYKGSIRLVNRLATAFNARVGVYELLVDKRILDNNLQWVFIPKPIYLDTTISQINTYLDYNTIYNKVPEYLISHQNWEIYNNENSLVLPVKSNILYVDYDLSTNHTFLKAVVTSAILAQYRLQNISIYFDNTTFTTSILGFHQLWFYLLLKYYNSFYAVFPERKLNFFDIDNFPYKLSDNIEYDIGDLLNEYENITNRVQFDRFYNDRIHSEFYTTHSTVSEVTPESLEVYFASISSPVSAELFAFIQELLISSEDIGQNYVRTFTYLINSLTTFILNSTDHDIKTYGNYLVEFYTDSLSTIGYEAVKNETFYNYLIEFKPHHTSVLVNDVSVFEVKDKFNTVYVDADAAIFVLPIEAVTAVPMDDSHWHEIKHPYYDNVITNSLIEKFIWSFKEPLLIEDEFTFVIPFTIGTVVQVDEDTENKRINTYESDNTIINSLVEKFKWSVREDYNVEENVSHSIIYPIATNEIIDIDTENTFYINSYNNDFQDDVILSTLLNNVTISYDGVYIFDDTNIIQTNSEGVTHFFPGDYIYSPGSDASQAGLIVNVDLISNTFTLAYPYEGEIGIFSKAYRTNLQDIYISPAGTGYGTGYGAGYGT
jgi:hypothetical protein